MPDARSWLASRLRWPRRTAVLFCRADMWRARPSICALTLVVLTAMVAAGCAPARPFTPGFYSPQHLTKLPGPLPPIAVYALLDERGTSEPTLILEFASISGHNRRDHATEPVSDGVARAFVEAFRARGFPVLDMTTKQSPGGSKAEARVAISGRVLEFGARITRTGVFTYDQRVACKIVLEAREVSSGRSLWTKPYSKVTEGGLLPADPMTLLSRALAQVVDQAVSDPELLRIIQDRGRLSDVNTDGPHTRYGTRLTPASTPTRAIAARAGDAER